MENNVPCDSDDIDAAPESSIAIGGEFSRTHDIRPADIWNKDKKNRKILEKLNN